MVTRWTITCGTKSWRRRSRAWRKPRRVRMRASPRLSRSSKSTSTRAWRPRSWCGTISTSKNRARTEVTWTPGAPRKKNINKTRISKFKKKSTKRMTTRKKMSIEKGIKLIWRRIIPTVLQPHKQIRRKTFTRWRFSTLILNLRPQNNRFKLAHQIWEIRISDKIRKGDINALKTSETPTVAQTISIILWARTWFPNHRTKRRWSGSLQTITTKVILTPVLLSMEKIWTTQVSMGRPTTRPSASFLLLALSKINSKSKVPSWQWKRLNRQRWKEQKVSHLVVQLKKRLFTTIRMHQKRRKWVRRSTERPWSTRISRGLSDH